MKNIEVQIYYNLQNHPTFHSDERMVILVRSREHFVGLSSYYFMSFYNLTLYPSEECGPSNESRTFNSRENTLTLRGVVAAMLPTPRGHTPTILNFAYTTWSLSRHFELQLYHVVTQSPF